MDLVGPSLRFGPGATAPIAPPSYLACPYVVLARLIGVDTDGLLSTCGVTNGAKKSMLVVRMLNERALFPCAPTTLIQERNLLNVNFIA